MKYRPEIDGLRAIAVTAVILYHIDISILGLRPFIAGFLGVDIFFVISGYLITAILLRESAEGSFSLAGFYERRARRILPALSVIALAALPLGWFSMDGAQLRDLGESLLALSVFSSNILFWFEDGYFAGPSALKPLLHTWSLAVEEQYYVFFPLIVAVFARHRPAALIALLGVLFIASLSLAQHQAHAQPSAGFFLLPARGWELLAGALVAATERQRGALRLPMVFHHILPVLGLACIGIPMVVFFEGTPHPSLLTAIPVFGAVLLIAATGRRDCVTKILSSPLVVLIGQMSYSLYLWHFLILSYTKLFHLGTLPAGFAYWYFPVLLGLSWLSWRYIERPCRNKGAVATRSFILSIIAIWSVIAGAGLILTVKDGFPQRLGYPPGLISSFARDDSEGRCIDNPQAHVKDNDWHCVLGDRQRKSIDFILAGDSHAYSALPAFRDFAGRRGMKGIAATDSGCPPLLGIEPLRGDQGETNCKALNDRIYNFAKENGVKTIVLSARWDYYHTGSQLIKDSAAVKTPRASEDRLALMEMALRRTIDSYRAIGTRVILVGQVPTQSYEAGEIYKHLYLFSSDRPEDIKRHSIVRGIHDASTRPVRNLFERLRAPDVTVIDPAAIYCDEKACPVGTADMSFYYDDDHLSVAGTRKLDAFLEQNGDRLFR